jgi:hypothetical protein
MRTALPVLLRCLVLVTAVTDAPPAEATPRRWSPTALLAAPAWHVTGPTPATTADGAALILARAANGPLTRIEAVAPVGDFRLRVRQRGQRIMQAGYQARALLYAAAPAFDAQTLAGPAVRLDHAIHDAIDHSWLRLVDEAGGARSGGAAHRTLDLWLELARVDGAYEARFRSTAEGSPWQPLDYANPGVPVPLPASAPTRLGLGVDPNWNPAFELEFGTVELRADADADGLLDDEEAALGTSPALADSDADGLADAVDAWPLDVRRATPPPAFVPTLGPVSVSVQRGADTWYVRLANDAPETQRGMLALPGLSDETPVFRVAPDDDDPRPTLTAQAALAPFELGPDERGLFALEVDLPPVATDVANAPVRAPLAGPPVAVDIGALVVDPEGDALTFSVSDEDANMPGLVLADDMLFVSPPAACGPVSVAILAVDAAGGRLHLPVTVEFVGEDGPNTVAAGDFSGGVGEAPPAPWTALVWEGDFRAGVDPTGGVDRGPVGRVLGDGPGKAALFQRRPLEPGRYRLSARVAAAELRPGLWSQTSSLYLSGHGPVALNEPLVAGDTGWRPVELVFDVAPDYGPGVIVYFFGWGPGALYVDDVTLTRSGDCAPAALGLTIGAEIAPLTAALPATPGDDLLCGYCPALGGALCERCAARPAEPPAVGPRTLADFEVAGPVAFGSAEYAVEDVSPLGGARSARLAPGRYMVATPATGLPADWRGYDWLRIDVRNDGPAPASVYIEIRDALTRDYWSRVNWYTVAAPGRHTLHVPLQVFVGEKSVIRERRRLALDAITRLVVMDDALVPLVFDDVRLESEPPLLHDDPRIIKLDPGPATGPILPGFTGMTAGTDVRPRRRYGFRADTTFGRVEDRRHPDALLRDWVSITDGGLELELPPGPYHVWMMLEDPGYWEYFPNYAARTVRAEGRVLLDERPTADAFLARYFAHADDEVRPGDDPWARFIEPRYVPLRAVVDVEDGTLSLEFEGPTYACALSALVVAPADAPDIDFDGFEAGLWDRLRQHFGYEHTLVDETGPADGVVDSPAELVVARLPPGRFLRATTPAPAAGRPAAAAPETVTAPVDATSALDVGLWPASGDTLVEARLDLGPAPIAVSVHRVRHLLERLTADGAVHHVAPRLLDPLDGPLALPEGLARQLHFELTPAPAAAGGVFDGLLTLTFERAPARTLPVSVEVPGRPLRPLARDGLQVGYLGASPVYPSTVYPEVEQRRRADAAPALSLLLGAGFSAVTGALGGPALTGFAADGAAALDLTALAPSMALFAAAGDRLTGPVSTYGGAAWRGLPSYGTTPEIFGRPFDAALTSALSAFETERRARGWPALRISVGDEPSGDALAQSVALARAIRATGTGVETDVFTSLLDAAEPRAALIGEVDLMLLTHHSAAALDALNAAAQPWGLYNQGGRYRRGVYLYALRALGLRAYYQFAFSSVGADPYYALDAREDDLCGAFTHPDGRLRPTTDFLLFREAVTDLRALLTLEAAAQAAPDGPTRAAALAFLDEVRAQVPVGHDAPAPDDDGALDELRAAAFTHLAALDAPAAPEPDAAVLPTPDAAVLPTPDAAVLPTPDAAVLPTPDAAVLPTPDAAVLPTPDAAVLPTPDAAVLPTPDGRVVPDQDGRVVPDPDATDVPAPDGADVPAPDGADVPGPDASAPRAGTPSGCACRVAERASPPFGTAALVLIAVRTRRRRRR